MTKSLTEKCKECGREEFGYGSILNEDGYCPTCAIRHNEEKVKKLQEQLNIATRALKGISVWANTGNGGEQAVKSLCEKALKEMGVK